MREDMQSSEHGQMEVQNPGDGCQKVQNLEIARGHS